MAEPFVPEAIRSGRVPVETPDRCALQAQLRSDPLWGTAFPADRLLLVEQPGPWGRLGLLQSDFDPGVARGLIDGLDPQGIRVLAIRRPGRDLHLTHRRWAMADCRADRESLRWGTYRHDSELLGLLSGPLEDRVGSLPLDREAGYLVCAHGTHDVCCAVRGRPVASALEALRPGRVWECSHVGGDRFAANVLVVASGLLYGSVGPARVTELVAATDAGRALPPHLRGRVGWSPAAQAALAAVLTERPALPVSAVRVIGELATGDRIEVEFDIDGTARRVLVEVDRSVPHRLTCQARGPASVSVFRPLLGSRTE